MSEEEAFQAAIRASPGDDVARLVYADWLEEHGLPERAAFLRAECAAARGKALTARACRRYVKALPADWLRAVARPCVAGTVWVAADGVGPARVRFLPEGKLHFQRFARGADPAVLGKNEPKGVPGNWWQVGSVVLFDVNDYSDHLGRLDGERMPVRWTNRTKARGSWTFRRVELAPAPTRKRRSKKADDGG